MDNRPITTAALFGLLCTMGVFTIGCGTLEETVYLQNLDVIGPLNQPPVHINSQAKANDLYITPRFSLNRDKLFDSRMSGDNFPYDSLSFTGNHLHWSVPSAQIGCDLDYMLSNSVALNVGLSYASLNSMEFWGGNVGIGLPFDGDPLSGRFEAGVQLQTLWYDALTIVVDKWTPLFSSSTQTSSTYYHDVGRSTPWNLYGTLTLNTHSEGFIDGFGSVSISRQTVADFQPTHVDFIGPFLDYHYTDARANNTMTFLLVSPGLCFSITPSTELLTGVRIMAGLGNDNGFSTIVAPMVQVDVKM